MPRFTLRAMAALSILLVSTTALADLRTFDVDPQYQQEVFAALKRILTPDEGLIPAVNGRVEQLPSGQILVNADAATLEQIDKVLQTIRSHSAAAAPRALLRYWAVLGIEAENSTASAPSPPMPSALNDVLAEVKRIHGDLMFRVLGTAAVATSSGQFGEARGWPLSVEQTAHVQGDTLNASISMELTGRAPNTIGNSRIGNLSVRTSLRRGEFVVLGESHIQLAAGGGEGPVFFIVHWEE
jgi:hypothetical protein